MQDKKSGQRKVHIDLLRILACFCVVMIHTSALYWYHLPVRSMDWMICNVYDAISSVGVPMFVMVSGMLFLGKEGEIDIKRLYLGNILRLSVIYCIWGAVYSVWGIRESIGQPDFLWINFWSGMIKSKYHLWFIPMLIGIYMILPLLKTWVNHAQKKQVEYFLILFLILRVGVDTIRIFELPEIVEVAADLINVPLVCSYVGFFVLGHYLDKYPPEKTRLKFVWGAGVIGALGAVLVSIRMSLFYNEANAEAFGNYSIFTLLIVVAVFVFFKEKFSEKTFSASAEKWIEKISADTLGIYLIHMVFLEQGVSVGITPLGIGSVQISPIIGIPMIAILVFVLSMLVAAVLRRIPLIGKYIC